MENDDAIVGAELYKSGQKYEGLSSVKIDKSSGKDSRLYSEILGK